MTGNSVQVIFNLEIADDKRWMGTQTENRRRCAVNGEKYVHNLLCSKIIRPHFRFVQKSQNDIWETGASVALEFIVVIKNVRRPFV